MLVRGTTSSSVSLLPLPVVPLPVRVSCIVPLSSCSVNELLGFDGFEGAVWEYAQIIRDPDAVGISKEKLVWEDVAEVLYWRAVATRLGLETT